MLKIIEQIEALPDLENAGADLTAETDFLIDKGLDLLAKAAREMGDPELARFASQSRPPA